MRLSAKGALLVPLLLLGMIVLGTANRVSFTLMLIPMHNYPYFMSQFINFIVIPIFFPLVWAQMIFTRDITPEVRAFPQRRFAAMGALDTLAGFMVLMGGAHISGPSQVLLSQGAIPVTMVVTSVWLKRRYNPVQYVGAAAIIVGVVLSMLQSFLVDTKAESAEKAAGAATVLWALLYFSNNFPQAVSSVYKEISFRSVAIGALYMNAFVSLYQFLLGFPLAPVAALVQDISLRDIPEHMAQGAGCLFAGTHLVALYITFNVAYNIFLVLVLKYGSAALMFIATAVIIPLANILYTFPGIMGDNARPLSVYDIIGLLVILLGISLYRLAESAEEEGGPSVVERDGKTTTGVLGRRRVDKANGFYEEI